MALRRLEHYNIRSLKFEESIKFYTEVLSLHHGIPGAPMDAPVTHRNGAWLYDASGSAVVHMANYDPSDAERMKRLNAYLGPRDISSLNGSGAIDHIAFDAVDYDSLVGRCRDNGCEYFERLNPSGMRQLYVFDPNGIKIELNFASEASPPNK